MCDFCCICLEALVEDPVSCRRDHKIHFQCFHQLYMQDSMCTCPLCRERYPIHQVVNYITKTYSMLDTAREQRISNQDITNFKFVNPHVVFRMIISHIVFLMFLCCAIDLVHLQHTELLKCMLICENIFVLIERVFDHALCENKALIFRHISYQRVYTIKLLFSFFYISVFTAFLLAIKQ